MNWLRGDAIELARCLESIAPEYGAHIALTGGLLYKDGQRKDADFVLYRIRQVPQIDVAGFFEAAKRFRIEVVSDHGFVVKAKQLVYSIDFLIPERSDEPYIPERTT